MCGAPARWASAPPGRVPPGWPPGGRVLEEFRLVWIEEPLDAYDAEGHSALVASLDTPVATGGDALRRRGAQRRGAHPADRGGRGGRRPAGCAAGPGLSPGYRARVWTVDRCEVPAG
ncbi:enolase C-terminal domain-like protein [Streptomyces caniferus]|uniref:enolase C-terminal domain-like protein n=1 Tax=Streptomyces caniferus TaxID=285557 RepID=UPI002E2BEF87|nr:enolase C-terminal domain-like protein [Streptomyces caniferus]